MKLSECQERKRVTAAWEAEKTVRAVADVTQTYFIRSAIRLLHRRNRNRPGAQTHARAPELTTSRHGYSRRLSHKPQVGSSQASHRHTQAG